MLQCLQLFLLLYVLHLAILILIKIIMRQWLPASNRALERKWHEREYDIHLRKLQGMKGTLDINPPASFQQPKRKAKRD